MTTASRIGIQDQDGGVRSIYVYSDGYPEGVGAMLETNYGDRASAEAVLALGDLSVLGASVADDARDNHMVGSATRCIAYGRDRGEAMRAPKRHVDDGDFILGCYLVDYAYLLFSDGVWRYTRIGRANDKWHEIGGLRRAA